MYDMTDSYVWLIHMCDTLQPRRGACLIRVQNGHGRRSPCYEWHVPFLCVTWLIHTYVCVEHDSFICVSHCSPEAPLILYVSKMVKAADKGRFVAFGRIFSGTARSDSSVRVMVRKLKRMQQGICDMNPCMWCDVMFILIWWIFFLMGTVALYSATVPIKENMSGTARSDSSVRVMVKHFMIWIHVSDVMCTLIWYLFSSTARSDRSVRVMVKRNRKKSWPDSKYVMWLIYVWQCACVHIFSGVVHSDSFVRVIVKKCQKMSKKYNKNSRYDSMCVMWLFHMLQCACVCIFPSVAYSFFGKTESCYIEWVLSHLFFETKSVTWLDLCNMRVNLWFYACSNTSVRVMVCSVSTYDESRRERMRYCHIWISYVMSHMNYCQTCVGHVTRQCVISQVNESCHK